MSDTEVKGKPVVVTTEYKGVFFGFALEPTAAGDTAIELADAQMCVYWSDSIHGILGLAATGPDRRCKITPVVPKIQLDKVTAIISATDEAVKAWQLRPWS
jgi:hypothetical protein